MARHHGHTPGPWQLEGNWQENGRKLGGWVSTMHPSPVFELSPLVGEPAEIIANAHLISAAPDMLKALEMVKRGMMQWAVSDYAPEWKAVLSAIAKATATPNFEGAV